jgi:hypothetical protein
MYKSPAPSLTVPVQAIELRHRRSFILPAVLAGSLLLMGGRVVHAAGLPVAPQQFTIAGESITTSGTGFTTSIDENGLRIVVADGNASVQIGPLEVLDLSNGDDVTLEPVTDGTITSINVRVWKGEAAFRTLNTQMSAASANLEDDAVTILTPATSLSLATGVPDSDQAMDVTSPEDTVAAPLDETPPPLEETFN